MIIRSFTMTAARLWSESMFEAMSAYTLSTFEMCIQSSTILSMWLGVDRSAGNHVSQRMSSWLID